MPTCGPVRSQCLYMAPAEQRENYLPDLCDGSLIGANGASEPNADSDVFSMRTRVTENGEDCILNGTRRNLCTNAPVADLFAIYGTLDPQLGAAGICGFIVEKGTSGLSVGGKERQDGATHRAHPGELPGAGNSPARAGRARNRSVQLLDCLGTGAHSFDLSQNDASPARTLNRICSETKAIRPANRQGSASPANRI